MRSAFTLIEVVVVVTIVAILSALTIPLLQHRLSDARRSVAVQQLTMIEKSCSLYKATAGEWPANTNHGVVPPEVAASLDSVDFTSTPLGGTFDWNGPGTSIGHQGISIRFPRGEVPMDELLEIDAELDDGLLNDGTYRLLRGQYFQLCIEP